MWMTAVPNLILDSMPGLEATVGIFRMIMVFDDETWQCELGLKDGMVGNQVNVCECSSCPSLLRSMC